MTSVRYVLAAVLALCCHGAQGQQPPTVGAGDDDEITGWNLSVPLPSSWARVFHDWDAFPADASQKAVREAPPRQGVWEVVGSESQEPTLRRNGGDTESSWASLPEKVRRMLSQAMAGEEAAPPAHYPSLRLAEGYLVSVERGESGGTIVWCPDEAATLTEISRVPCMAFGRLAGKIVAVGGRRGLATTTGDLQVLREAPEGAAPALERVAVLPQPGLACCPTSRGTLLVVCETLVIDIRPDLSYDVVYGTAGLSLHLEWTKQTGTWQFSACLPSVRYVGEHIMIGTEAGFVYLKRVDSPGKARFQESWLLPKGLIPRVPPTTLYFRDFREP
jgi:hypothetical protein